MNSTAAGIDASVKFCAMCWPVADPLARYEMVVANGNERLQNAHHAFWPDEAAMSEGNPQLILERGEAAGGGEPEAMGVLAEPHVVRVARDADRADPRSSHAQRNRSSLGVASRHRSALRPDAVIAHPRAHRWLRIAEAFVLSRTGVSRGSLKTCGWNRSERSCG